MKTLEKCTHEDWITFGKTVFKDATTHVVLVTCDDCKAKGVQVEQYDDDFGDYTFTSEEWL